MGGPGLMGIVAEHIKKKLEQDIRTKGLLVWLDKENEFSPLVDTWIQQRDEGQFPYDIFAFRGSFLELMDMSKEVLSGRDMPKCVIHMPGFNEQEIKETPVLEAYKAGRRWRVSLEALIRESAQGRLSEDQTEFLLKKKGLNLSIAEEFITQEENVPLEIKRLLQKYGEDGIVLHFIKDPIKINEELCVDPHLRFVLIKEYFKTLIGLDEQWQEDWNPDHINYGHPDNQADLLVSYLMAMEFVYDLKVAPNSGRLNRLKEKPKEFFKKSSILLQQLRESDSAAYIKWAERVETNLSEEECRHNPKDLGSLDTFRFEADLFLNEAMELLEKRKWYGALELAEIRLPGRKKDTVAHTFWLQQDRKRRWLWKWVEIASRLGQMSENIFLEVKNLDPDIMIHQDMIQLYTESWWNLDQLHRKFSSSSERYQSINSDLHIKAFVEIRKSLHQVYRDCIDRQSYIWNSICERKGFLPSESLQQRQFFNNWVKPVLEKKKKTAILFVDALRYELGQQLIKELETICTTQNIHNMLAELPTITSVGMNALIPVVKESSLTPLFDKKEGIVGFQGGERQVKNPGERKLTLQDYVGIEISWINLVDFLSFSDRKLNRIVDKKLLVLTALDIDKMGESGALSYGIDYFETGIGRLKTAVMKLKEKGFEEFIITADHGFLLGDESLQINKAPKLSNVERRHATDTYRNSKNLISVKLIHLNYKTEDPDKSFIFERSTHILNTTRKTFYHGGNTLQERLVPVIAFSFTKNLPDSSGSFDLQIRKKPETLGFHRISVLPRPRDGFLFALSEIEIQILSDDGVIFEIGDVVGGRCIGDLLILPVGVETEILFKLSKGDQPKAQIYFQATKQAISLQNSSFDEFFDVKDYGIPVQTTSTQKKSYDTKDSPSLKFSSEIPEEFHIALAHLNKHGSLTETFLVNTLGGDRTASRKARRFALKIEEWLPYLPFDLGIELTSEGIEYRKL